MGDPGQAASLLTGQWTDILNFLAAAAGLGTASMGLVDATKAFRGGVSNVGFADIQSALHPFLEAASPSGTSFGKKEVLGSLKSNWLNGVAKDDQKAKAKALIHLGLTAASAPALARAAGVDESRLTSLAQKLAAGQAAGAEEMGIQGHFDTVLGAVLDAAYERADQRYRNASKGLAMGFSIVLGVVAGAILIGCDPWHLALSALVGLCATPLAPIAKDLASSLQAAAGAVSVIKG